MSHHKPQPMPAVIDPYTHIMEKIMPTNPEPHDGVPHLVKAEASHDGKVVIWVKDRMHAIEISEAYQFAQHLLEQAELALHINRATAPPVIASAPVETPAVATDPPAA